MNEEITKKNIAYQEDITKIAKSLFYSFYYDEEERIDEAKNQKEYEEMNIELLKPKAETILNFFESYTEAIKTIRFLHIKSPHKAKEIFDTI